MRYRHEIKTALAIALPSSLLTSILWGYLPRAIMTGFTIALLFCVFIEVLILCGLDINRLARQAHWRLPRRRSRFVFLPW